MLFDQHRTSPSLAEIARQIGVPRSSTFRLVYTLNVGTSGTYFQIRRTIVLLAASSVSASHFCPR